MDCISVVEVLVRARPGAISEDCVRASLLLALKERRTVRLMHNEVEYLIASEKFISSILEGE